MTIRDRVVRLDRIRAGDLRANPKNWRRHPQAQQDAMAGVLREVGFADALLAYETPDGLTLVDGHLRAGLDPDMVVPVLVLDLDEAEADKMLATYDPIAAMADTDSAALADLLHGLEVGDRAVAAMLEALTVDGLMLPHSNGGWHPSEDTSAGTAMETVGYDLTSVWPRDGDAETKAYPHFPQLPRSPGESEEAFRRNYSRSPALEMERIVRTYMRPGDTFLEVCAGWFTFSLTAAIWGYHGAGVDVWPTSLTFAKRQRRVLRDVAGAGDYQVVDADALALPYDADTIPFVYCNPPFFQLEHYSEDARDLANRPSVDAWLADCGRMMAEMKRVAVPGGLIVTVMADYRKDGLLVPLHADWMAEGQRQGLELWDLVVQTMRTEQVRIWRKAYDRRRTIKAQEYVVIFRKPPDAPSPARSGRTGARRPVTGATEAPPPEPGTG